MISTPRLLLAAILLVLAPGLRAQPAAFPVTGTITDADQARVVGYRVVFRAAGTGTVYLSPPTDEEGAYRVDVPTGTNLQPVAVISPLGKRVGLDGMTPRIAMPGLRFDVELPFRVATVVEPRPFPGADRLFRAFIEDVAFVEDRRAQAGVSAADYEDATSYTTELLAAFHFTSVPWLEVGGRVGYAGTEYDPSGTGASGPTDLDLWGKLLVYSSPRNGMRSAAGVVLTLPTGEPETGRATGAVGLKLFGALRYGLGRVTLSGNAGLRANADSDLDGVDRSGEISGSVGAAALMPFGDRLVGLVEVDYETGRYDGGEDQGQALLGVNWKVLREGVLRLALSFGLADGSPDTELTAGYAFEF